LLVDLERAGYSGAIHLYLMGEPLLDERLPAFIAMARGMFPLNTLFISTNGDFLKSEQDVKRLFDAWLTWMGISHYDTANDHLYGLEKKYKIAHTPLSRLRATFYNRGGNVPVESVDVFPSCGWVFSKAYVNHRGDVILCCSDYHYEVVFGNIAEEDFVEIFNNEKYGAYRRAHENRIGKTMPLCDKCNRIGGVQ
jgi:radical SAM protein with 4Fe4S-binding SPASM domain